MFHPERINLILGHNEAGKSTLLHALFYGLYGFNKAKAMTAHRFGLAKTKEELNRRYRPWDASGALRIAVEVESCGTRYRIERDLEVNKAVIWNLNTGEDVTQGFQVGRSKYAIAETLLGVDESVFLNTLCVTQSRIQAFEVAEDATAVVSEIQRVVDAAPGGLTVREALASLEVAQKKYYVTGKSRNRDALAELKDEYRKVQSKLDALEALHQETATALEKNQHLADTLAGLKQQIEVLEWQQRRAECLYLEAQVALEQQSREKQVALEAEVEALAGCASVPIERQAALKEEFRQWQHLQAEAEELQRQVETDEALVPEAVLETTSLEALLSWVTAAHEACRRVHDFGQSAGALKTALLQEDGLEERRFSVFSQRFEALTTEGQRFLSGYLLERSLAETAVQEVERHMAELAEKTRQIEAARKRTFLVNGILLTLGAVMVSVGLIAGQGWVSVGLMTLGAILLVMMLVKTFQLGKSGEQMRQAEALAEGRHRLQGAEASLSQLSCRFETWHPHFVDLFPEPEAFRVELAWFFQARTSRVLEWQSLLGQQRQSFQELLTVLAKLPEAIRPSCPEDLLAPLSDWAVLQAQWVALKEKIQTTQRVLLAREKFAGVLERKTLLMQGIRSVLADPETDEATPLDTLMAAFEKRCEDYRRWKELQETLRHLQGTLPSQVVQQQRQERLATLKAQLETAPEALPEVTVSEAEYREQLAVQRQAYAQTQEAFRKSETEIVETREKIYRERPLLKAQAEELADQIQRLSRFQASLSTAYETLAALGGEHHREWAPILNQRANHYLKAFNQRYGQLRFGENLSFDLEELASGKWLDMASALRHLSVGARDQVYLAIRLAIAQYLADQHGAAEGRSVRFPLLMDDPFVHWDDHRFEEALTLLAGVSQPGAGPVAWPQILLMSCHVERHLRWMESLGEGAQERLHLIPLGAQTQWQERVASDLSGSEPVEITP
jgi:DNA repair exonuclease SbcCD ATPase subunit